MAHRRNVIWLLFIFFLISSCRTQINSEPIPEPHITDEKSVDTATPQPLEIINSTESLVNIIALLNKEIYFSQMPEGMKYIEMDQNFFHHSYKPVIYTGGCRKVSEDRSEIINAWLSVLGYSVDDLDPSLLFEVECSFSQGEEDYWLPMQNMYLDKLANDYSAGDQLNPYIYWIGGIKEEEAVDYIFVITELEAE